MCHDEPMAAIKFELSFSRESWNFDFVLKPPGMGAHHAMVKGNGEISSFPAFSRINREKKKKKIPGSCGVKISAKAAPGTTLS